MNRLLRFILREHLFNVTDLTNQAPAECWMAVVILVEKYIISKYDNFF